MKKPRKQKVGESTSGRLEMSKGRRRAQARARRREEQEWAAKAGPVIVRMRGESDAGV